MTGDPIGGKAVMSVQDDQLIYEYLGKGADAAAGRLPSLARQDLVEKVRHEIDDRRRRYPKLDITRILQSMGDPRDLVDRAIQLGGSEYAGYRPPITAASAHPQAPVVRPAGSPGQPPAGSPAGRAEPMPAVSGGSARESAGSVAGTAPVAVTALFPPSPDPLGPPGRPTGPTKAEVAVPERGTQVIRRRMTQYGPMTWLRTRRAARATRGRPASETGEYPAGARAQTTLQPAALARTYGREAAALFALTVVTLWKPYLGWPIGLALVLWSKNWSIRDKGIAVSLIPAATLGGGIFYVWLTVGRNLPPDITASERLDRVGGDILGVFKAWPIVAALLAAFWLMAQLLARWAGEQRERWR